MFQGKEVATQAHNSQTFQQCVELYFIHSNMGFLRTFPVNPKHYLRDSTITSYKLKGIELRCVDNTARNANILIPNTTLSVKQSCVWTEFICISC
jgi:hypothetical protein